jgi:hypothetical protein
MLVKIVQHNLWPVVKRSDLILKRAQFVYAIHLRLPFCICKHILGIILEARDESNTSLPLGYLPAHIDYTTVKHQYSWRAKDEDLGSTQQADADEVKCSATKG